ncbi:MAG TPA: DUF2110 family protein [candidate division Zixibacteria bacterium]|nr:DUF2110 family protein [candidate division Zixibacteria bacterium]
MPTVTLFAKAHKNRRLDNFDKNVKSTLEGLKVEVKTCGATARGWIQISVSGEDENVALHYLDDRIGLCPASFENINRFSTIKGRITNLDNSRNELRVDMGVFSPNIYDATIPLARLQAQLVDGRKTTLKEIVELFGFSENLPITVKIDNVDKDKSLIEAEVAEKQRRQYIAWTESLLDRLLILGASHSGIELAVEQAGFNRDVVNIEPLGGFEYAVACKLGTDAVGLIPRVGKNLRNASMTVFSPRRIFTFFENKLPLPISY